MRVRNFFLYSDSLTDNGGENTFDVPTVSAPDVTNGDVVFAGLMLSGTLENTNDPYGNVKVSVASRTVSNGQISNLEFSKSEISLGTTDRGDVIIIAAR